MSSLKLCLPPRKSVIAGAEGRFVGIVLMAAPPGPRASLASGVQPDCLGCPVAVRRSPAGRRRRGVGWTLSVRAERYNPHGAAGCSTASLISRYAWTIGSKSPR